MHCASCYLVTCTVLVMVQCVIVVLMQVKGQSVYLLHSGRILPPQFQSVLLI